MNAEAERYLRRATRGLWGRRRQEVREELAAHLEGRVTAHQIAGFSERDATEKALAELGSPRMVSAGMARLYTLPPVMGSSLAVIVLCLAVAALWPKGFAQTLEGTFYYPTYSCLRAIANGNDKLGRSNCAYVNNEFWVDIEAAQRALEPQGVTFKKYGFAAEALSVTVPGTTPFFIEPYSRESVSGIGSLARGYVSFWNVVERFADNENARLRISGWDDPTLFLNEASFGLSDGAARIGGEAFYKSYLSAVLDQGLTENERWGSYKTSIGVSYDEIVSLSSTGNKTAFRNLHLTVDGLPGDPYGFVFLIDPASTLGQKLADAYEFEDAAFYYLEMARVGRDGTVSVSAPEGEFRLVDDVSFPDVQPGDAVLVRLAGGNSQSGGWYEVIPPEDITPTTQN